jgi:MFS family permease
MGLFIRRYHGKNNLTNIARLSVVCFLSYIGIALGDTLWALKLEEIFESVTTISFFAAGLSVISFLAYFLFIPLIQRKSKTSIFLSSLLVIAFCYILFGLVKNVYVFSAIAIISVVSIALKITSFGIIIKDKSNPKLLSRNEGLIWSFMNLAWVFGPLMAGFISNYYGMDFVFILAGICMLLTLLSFKSFNIIVINTKKKVDENIFKNFIDFFKDKKRRDAYVLGGAVNFWMVLLYFYMPLIIIQKGLHDQHVGYFLFLVALPLIFLEYKMSSLAGKIGFKKIFRWAFLFMALIAITCFFIESIWIIFALLTLASIGQSMIEPTTEAYFFDVLKSKSEEDRFYGPYNTTIDTNHFLGKVLAGIVLLFFPIQSVFILFGVIMFLYFLYSFRIKDFIENPNK